MTLESKNEAMSRFGKGEEEASSCWQLGIVRGSHLCLLPTKRGDSMSFEVASISLEDIRSQFDQRSSVFIENITSTEENDEICVVMDILLEEFSNDCAIPVELMCREDSKVSADKSQISIICRNASNAFEVAIEKHSHAHNTGSCAVIEVESSGYFIGYFSSLEENECVLFLPEAFANKETDLWINKTPLPMQRQKELLLSILRNSVLVSIEDIFHSRSSSNSKWKKTLPNLGSSIDGEYPKKRKRKRNNDINPIYESDCAKSSPTEKWRKQLNTAMKEKIYTNSQKLQRHITNMNIMDQLNKRSRKSAKELSVCVKSSSDKSNLSILSEESDIQVTYLEYDVEHVPDGFTDLSFRLNLSIDVSMKNNITSSSEVNVYNVKLSCTPQTRSNFCTSVETVSSVIPIMRRGDCYRMLVAVDIKGVGYNSDCALDVESLALSASYSTQPTRYSQVKTRYLTSFKVPRDYRSKDCFNIANPITKFSQPTAIFDFRHPWNISIHVPAFVTDEIEYITNSIVDDCNSKNMYNSSKVCASCQKEKMRIDFTILATSWHSQLLLLKDLLSHIPEGSKIWKFGTLTNIDEDATYFSLLRGIQKELSEASMSKSAFLSRCFENDHVASFLSFDFLHE